MTRRNCSEIIEKMLALIPEDKKEFIKALEWNLEDSKYKAPDETLQWRRTAETLGKFILNPKEEWEFKIVAIFTNESVEQVIVNIGLQKETEEESEEVRR